MNWLVVNRSRKIGERHFMLWFFVSSVVFCHCCGRRSVNGEKRKCRFRILHFLSNFGSMSWRSPWPQVSSINNILMIFRLHSLNMGIIQIFHRVTSSYVAPPTRTYAERNTWPRHLLLQYTRSYFASRTPPIAFWLTKNEMMKFIITNLANKLSNFSNIPSQRPTGASLPSLHNFTSVYRQLHSIWAETVLMAKMDGRVDVVTRPPQHRKLLQKAQRGLPGEGTLPVDQPSTRLNQPLWST